MKKKVLLASSAVFFGAIVAGAIFYKAYQESARNKQIDQEIGALRDAAEKIRKNNMDLEEKISYYQTPEYQEKRAKDTLNVQKEGESVVIVKPNQEAKEQETQTAEKANEKLSLELPNYKKWWNYFFK
jgi:cell division protein FtsB